MNFLSFLQQRPIITAILIVFLFIISGYFIGSLTMVPSRKSNLQRFSSQIEEKKEINMPLLTDLEIQHISDFALAKKLVSLHEHRVAVLKQNTAEDDAQIAAIIATQDKNYEKEQNNAKMLFFRYLQTVLKMPIDEQPSLRDINDQLDMILKLDTYDILGALQTVDLTIPTHTALLLMNQKVDEQQQSIQQSAQSASIDSAQVEEWIRRHQ